jgi:hypothetical protein
MLGRWRRSIVNVSSYKFQVLDEEPMAASTPVNGAGGLKK